MTIISIIIIFIILIAISIKIVPSKQIYIVERLGKYYCSWNTGIYIGIPLIDRVVKKVPITEQSIKLLPQPIITKDNTTVPVGCEVYFCITDAKTFAYNTNNTNNINADIENLTTLTLRNVIGDLNYDEFNSYINTVGYQTEAVLNEIVGNWGIKVNRVELNNINI